MAGSREVQALLKELDEQGFTFKYRGNHYKVTNPAGGFTFISASPSDPRAIKNMTADLRKIGADL